MTFYDDFKNYAESILRHTREALPVESRSRKLEVNNLRLEDASPERIDHWHEFQKAKETGGSFLGRVVGDVKLVDKKTGKTVDELKNHTINFFPHMTALGGYVVGGNELQVVNQLRRLPGVYPVERPDNNVASKITAAGLNHDVIFDRQNGDLLLKVRSSHLKLVPLLQEMGVSDAAIKEHIGEELFKQNAALKGKRSELGRFHELTRRIAKPSDPEELKKITREFLASKALKISEETIGHKHENVSPELYLHSAKAAIDVARGKRQPADMESLVYKSIHNAEDFVDESMKEAYPHIKRKLAYLMDRKDDLRTILNPGVLAKPIINQFVSSEFTRYSNQNNPLDILGTMLTVTSLGEGGIQSEHAITDSLRNVHNSQLGFMDAVHTPEASSIGVVGHLSFGVKKRGNQLVQKVYDTQEKKIVEATPREIAAGGLGFPDQYRQTKDGHFEPLKAKVVGVHGGEVKVLPHKELRYVLPSPSNMFSLITNGIPFLNANSANRMLMADRHIEQTVPLENAEVPLVQSSFGGDAYDKVMNQLITRNARGPGKVTAVKKDHIAIHYDGEKEPGKIFYPDAYPLNGESFWKMTPTVKTGQRIKAGQSLFDSNFTKDGHLAMGTNLVTAVMPWRGASYEDGIVISENAARKLTSAHKHELVVDKTGGTLIDHEKLFDHFPEERQKYAHGGGALPKVGQVIKPGQLVIPAISPIHIDPDTDYGRVHKVLKLPFHNSSVYWDHDVDGVVKKVINTHGMTKVYIETKEPLIIGDKLSSRSGGKGIVTQILPMDQMPRRKDGTPIDVLFNPFSLPGRVNPTFLLESAYSKIARKTGDTQIVKSFDPHTNYLDDALAALKKHGLSETEEVDDPTHKTTHKNITVGENYWLKLKHQVRHKLSARSHEGSYTQDERPARGGHESAQSIGPLELYSLLSGGSTNFLHDAAGIKSNKNAEYWSSFQLGLPTPAPKPPMILEKFDNFLRGAGINVKRTNTSLKMSPLTDSEILKMSRGRIDEPLVFRSGRDRLVPEKGGLFDEAITGGFSGAHAAHIELPERILNPLYEQPVMALLGMTKTDLEKVLSGKEAVDGKYGGEAIAHLLDKIDVKADLKETTAAVRTASKTKRDKLLKKLRYLNALDQLNLKPTEAYTNKYLHVIAPKFRPIYDMPDGSLNVADANHGYREALFIGKELEELKKQGVSDKQLQPLRRDLYAAVSGLVGTTEPLTRSGHFKGFISQIAGAQNKTGLYQSKIVARRQDLSGRSTIINGPHLGIDEVGIPQEMARKIYQPYLVRELVNVGGLKPLDARKEIEENSERVQRMLEYVMRERPVYINRAPSLHKFSVVPLIAHPVPGKSIQLNPLVFGGLNADIDGDTVAVHVPHSEEAREEAFRKLPSKQIFSPKSGDVQHMVGAESTLGLYMMTRPDKEAKPVKISSIDEAMKMVRENKLRLNSPVEFGGHTWTPGHFMINEALPVEYRLKTPTVIDGKKWSKLANDIAHSHPEQAGRVISQMKDLGFDASTRLGFSIDLKSLREHRERRDAIMKEVQERAKEDPAKAISWGTKEVEKLMDDLSEDNPYRMMSFGSGAKNKHRINIRQLMFSPVGVTDNKGKIVPVPITRSYVEGLGASEYWATFPGARKGIADRAVSTQDTGAFAKELVNTTINMRVTDTDCKTTQGISMSPTHPDFVGRYLVDGRLVTPALQAELAKKGGSFTVRSALTCQLPHGVCQRCAGLNESGQHHPIGFHIGAYAGTTISEPITQMVLRSFHSQGAIGAKEVGYKRVRQIFSMPENIRGKATLSAEDGHIEALTESPGGGWDVTVNGVRHFVPLETGLDDTIKLGMPVKKGQQLSKSGVLKIQEVAELRGHEAARDQIIKDLDDEMSAAGQNIRRRIYEMAVKPMIDKVYVDDPGDAVLQGVVEGAVMNVNQVRQMNEKLKHPIKFHPMVMSVKEVPFVGEDPVGPLMYQRIPRTLKEGPAVGAEAKLVGPQAHPLVEYAYGHIGEPNAQSK